MAISAHRGDLPLKVSCLSVFNTCQVWEVAIRLSAGNEFDLCTNFGFSDGLVTQTLDLNVSRRRTAVARTRLRGGVISCGLPFGHDSVVGRDSTLSITKSFPRH